MQNTIVGIHDTIIRISGGENGVRDEGGIYNSTYRLLNYQGKFKQNPIKLGAFIMNEFAKKHHFVDGNKRTAYVVAKIFMLINKCHLKIDYKNSLKTILEIAKYGSKMDFEKIKIWLDENCILIEEKDVEKYLNQVFVNLYIGENEYEK